MPNSNSAKKRLRQNLARRARNRSVKSAVRTQVRKVREAVAAGDVTTGETEFRLAAKRLDKAAAAGVVHANLAARVKSRLSAALKAGKGK
ncbi:MAG: 30S ribosomal protein S20 [Pirellulales bacterium]